MAALSVVYLRYCCASTSYGYHAYLSSKVHHLIGHFVTRLISQPSGDFLHA